MIRSTSRSVVTLPRIVDPPILPVLLIGEAGRDDAAAALAVHDDLTDSDVARLSALRCGLWRSVFVSMAIPDDERATLSVALADLGMKVAEAASLPASTAGLWTGAKVRHGRMAGVVRSICGVLADWRTLWRTNGQAAVLELPVGGDPWLRPLDVAEVEVLIDALGVEADDEDAADDYLLSRVAHAVHAGLPSWLPPAADVAWADTDEVPGYDPANERILLSPGRPA